MNLLQQWLDGSQDYETGRTLYEQFGENPRLKLTLSHGPTAYNKSALREELAKLLKAGKGGDVQLRVLSPADQAVLHQAEQALTHVVSRTAGLADPVVTLVADLESQWKPLYKDASTMQSLLEYAKDNTERCERSHEILNHMDKVHALWEKQAYVQAHGELPPVVELAAPAALDLTDRAAVEQARNNLRSNISKQKRNQARATEVEAWRMQVKQLSDLLKTL